MAHLVVYDGSVSQFEQSNTSPLTRDFTRYAHQKPYFSSFKPSVSLSEVNKILSNPCPTVVPYKHATYVDTWQNKLTKSISCTTTLNATPSHPLLDLAASGVGTSKSVSLYTAKPRLIELASYPGYTPDTFTPLPFDIKIYDILERLTRSHKNILSKCKFLLYWRHNIFTPKMSCILLDLFWWIYLDNLASSKNSIQERLFARIAINYGEFVTALPDNKYSHRNVFLKFLPDFACQVIVSAFLHAYPTSWKVFDNTFKHRLCEIVYHWFIGIPPPIPSSWRHWRMASIEPDDILEHKSLDLRSSKSDKINLKQELDSLHISKPEIATADTDRPNLTGNRTKSVAFNRVRTSHPLGPSYLIEKSLFDTSGNTPLMAYYLQSQNFTASSKISIFLTRTDAHDTQSKSTKMTTYRDILSQYNAESKVRHTKMHQISVQTNNSVMKKRRETEKEIKRLNEMLRKIHKDPEEAKFLSRKLLTPMPSDELITSIRYHNEYPYKDNINTELKKHEH